MAPLFILYGSATGNSEDIAKNLASEFKPCPTFDSVICLELNQFKSKCMPTWSRAPTKSSSKYGVIVVCSTTGNGESPENAGRFVRFVKRKSSLSSMPFQHCAFAVLGLGDTNYDDFCASGRVIDEKLKALGGVRAKDLGMADEATGLEDVVEPWVESVFGDMRRACGGEDVVEYSSPSGTEMSGAVPELQEEEVERSSDGSDGPLSEGVKTILEMMCCDCVPDVCDSSVPGGRSNFTSCKVVSEDSRSLSASNTHKNIDEDVLTNGYDGCNPYRSKIVDARYLTNTSTHAAEVAAKCLVADDDTNIADQRLVQAMDCYDSYFPLCDQRNEAKVQEEHELNGKRVIEMSVALPDDASESFNYEPGDSIGILIPNSPSETMFLLSFLLRSQNLQAHQLVSLTTSTSSTTQTVDSIIRSKMDVSSTLKHKHILSSLSQIATDDAERRCLRLLSSKTELGESLFLDYITKERRNVVDIIRDFPSVQNSKLTLDHLINSLPPLPPRYYSVTSSPLEPLEAGSQSLSVAFSVVDYLTPKRRRIGGIATRRLEVLSSPFLSSTTPSSTTTIQIFPKPSNHFHLPPDTARPLVFIGPGTGVAPFIGFLKHRSHQINAATANTAPTTTTPTPTPNTGFGDADMYFGCRYQHHDWLYRDQMMQFQRDGVLDYLETAFSRQGHNNSSSPSSSMDTHKKVYVQTIMSENSKCSTRLLRTIMDRQGIVYLCGDGNQMARDVQNSLVRLIATRFITDDDEHQEEKKDNVTKMDLSDHVLKRARDYLQQMKSDKRLLLDIWT